MCQEELVLFSCGFVEEVKNAIRRVANSLDKVSSRIVEPFNHRFIPFGRLNLAP